MVDLRVDLLLHFGGEHHAVVAALKVVLTAEIGMLVKNHLIHIEFIKVGVKQRHHDRL